jgi:aspartate aminotransferase
MFDALRSLYNEWTAELKDMADRIIKMRHLLHQALRARGNDPLFSVILQSG